jgi:deazaflavin-dependent oxidoreductase (nitroreductase family)
MAVEITPSGTRGQQTPKWGFKIANWLAVPIYKLLGKRFPNGLPLLLLTTVGAKSGQERKTTLCYLQGRGDREWLIIASKGGDAEHPAWYFNLAKNPDKVWIEVDGRKTQVRPESLKGEERAEAWQRLVAAAPGYGEYQVKTDREIPLVRLTPV